MNTNKLLYYKIYKSFKKSIDLKLKFENKPSEKSVHKARISIRRLLPMTKLYLLLIKDKDTSAKIKLLNKEIKYYFDILSPSRDQYVNIMTCEAIGIDDSYVTKSIKKSISQLAEETKKQTLLIDFDSKMDDFIYLLINNHNLIDENVENILNEQTKTYSKLLLKKLKKVDENTSIEKYHKIRIIFKKLRYTTEIYNHLDINKDFNPKSIKKIQDSLGYFQDLSVLRNYFFENDHDKKLIKIVDKEINKVLHDILLQKEDWIKIIKSI